MLFKNCNVCSLKYSEVRFCEPNTSVLPRNKGRSEPNKSSRDQKRPRLLRTIMLFKNCNICSLKYSEVRICEPNTSVLPRNQGRSEPNKSSRDQKRPRLLRTIMLFKNCYMLSFHFFVFLFKSYLTDMT